MRDLAARPKNGRTDQRTPSRELLELLARELLLTGAMFRTEITELISVGYREALSDLTPSEIERGFREARKKLKFFPLAAEIRELATNSEPTHYFDAGAFPAETPEQRAESKRIWESFFPSKR